MKYDELERIMHINNFTQHQQDEKRSLGKLIFHISFKSDIEYNQGNGRRIEQPNPKLELTNPSLTSDIS